MPSGITHERCTNLWHRKKPRNGANLKLRLAYGSRRNYMVWVIMLINFNSLCTGDFIKVKFAINNCGKFSYYFRWFIGTLRHEMSFLEMGILLKSLILVWQEMCTNTKNMSRNLLWVYVMLYVHVNCMRWIIISNSYFKVNLKCWTP